MARWFCCITLLVVAPAGARAADSPLEAARSALIQEAAKPRGRPTGTAVDQLEALGLVYLEACNQCASLQDCDADRKAILSGHATPTNPCSPPPGDREGRGLLAQGLAAMKAGRHHEATLPLKRAVAAGVVEAHLHLGSCLAKLGRVREGAWHYEEFLLKAPGAPQAASVRELLRSHYLQTRTQPRVPGLLDQPSHASLRPPSPPPGSAESARRDAALEKGKRWIVLKQYRKALGPLQEAARAGASEGHLYLGIAYAYLGDSDRGAWHYEEFVHLEPGHRSVPQARAILKEFFARSRNRKPRYPQ